MYDNSKRSIHHKKDESLELILKKLNTLIEPQHSDKLTPKMPIVLIMGCPRSGSTLMMQYLASQNIFSYPSNLIARYYKNPEIGILSQLALKDLINSNEFTYNSNLGKTKGILAPSEFWYFWREHFQFSKYNYLTDKEIKSINTSVFTNQLASFEIHTGLPLLMKGMILNWNIPFLHKIYPKFIFINLKRDTIANAQSLLQARKSFFNNENNWYSFKPLEFENLKELSPIEQVVGQVHYTQRAIENGLNNIPHPNQININYEDFCENPYQLLELIQSKYEALGFKMDIPENKNEKFTAKSTANNFNESELNKFTTALLKYD